MTRKQGKSKNNRGKNTILAKFGLNACFGICGSFFLPRRAKKTPFSIVDILTMFNIGWTLENHR